MTRCVCMTAGQKRGTICAGVADGLGRRLREHKSRTGFRFTARYGARRLVWYEEHFNVRDAIRRETSVSDGRGSGRSN